MGWEWFLPEGGDVDVGERAQEDGGGAGVGEEVERLGGGAARLLVGHPAVPALGGTRLLALVVMRLG